MMDFMNQLKSGTQIPFFIVPFLQGVRRMGVVDVFCSLEVDKDGDHDPHNFVKLVCFSFESGEKQTPNPLEAMFGKSSSTERPPAGFAICPILRCNQQIKHVPSVVVLDLFAMNHYIDGFRTKFKSMQEDWENQFNALDGHLVERGG